MFSGVDKSTDTEKNSHRKYRPVYVVLVRYRTYIRPSSTIFSAQVGVKAKATLDENIVYDDDTNSSQSISNSKCYPVLLTNMY